MKSYLLPITIILLILFSCSHVNNNNKKNKTSPNLSDLKKSESILINKDSTKIKDLIRTKKDEKRIRSNFIIGQKYNIQGDNIIQKGSSLNSEKLINKKASDIFNKIIYAKVDRSTKVIVEDINGYWAKIKVIEPVWLSSTHKGWIMAYNIIGEDKTDRHFISKLNRSFFVTLLENINKKPFIDSTLKNLNFHEESNGFYKSNEETGNKSKHIVNVNDLADMVIIHSSDTIFWKKIIKELKGIQKQEAFQEGSYSGKRYVDGKITFETLKPKNGIDIDKNIFYDLYVYRTKNHK